MPAEDKPVTVRAHHRRRPGGRDRPFEGLKGVHYREVETPSPPPEVQLRRIRRLDPVSEVEIARRLSPSRIRRAELEPTTALPIDVTMLLRPSYQAPHSLVSEPARDKSRRTQFVESEDVDYGIAYLTALGYAPGPTTAQRMAEAGTPEERELAPADQRLSDEMWALLSISGTTRGVSRRGLGGGLALHALERVYGRRLLPRDLSADRAEQLDIERGYNFVKRQLEYEEGRL